MKTYLITQQQVQTILAAFMKTTGLTGQDYFNIYSSLSSGLKEYVPVSPAVQEVKPVDVVTDKPVKASKRK